MASATVTNPVPPAPDNGMKYMVCIRLPTAAAHTAPPEGIAYTFSWLYKLIFEDSPRVSKATDNLVDTAEPTSNYSARPASADWSKNKKWRQNVLQYQASLIILAANENSIYNHLRRIWMPEESVANFALVRDTNAWLERLMRLFDAQHNAMADILDQMYLINRKITKYWHVHTGKRVDGKQLTMASIRVKLALSDQQAYMYGPIHDFCWQALQPGDHETRMGDPRHGLEQAELATMKAQFNHRAGAYTQIMQLIDEVVTEIDVELAEVVLQFSESEEEPAE